MNSASEELAFDEYREAVAAAMDAIPHYYIIKTRVPTEKQKIKPIAVTSKIPFENG